MTTHVIVKNKESSHWEVIVSTYDKISEGTYAPSGSETVLKPGEEVEVMIYSHRNIQVREGSPIPLPLSA